MAEDVPPSSASRQVLRTTSPPRPRRERPPGGWAWSALPGHTTASLVGVWLALWYLVALFLVGAVLTAAEVHNSVSQDENLALPEVLAAIDERDNLREGVDTWESERDRAQVAFESAVAARDSAELDLNRAEARLAAVRRTCTLPPAPEAPAPETPVTAAPVSGPPVTATAAVLSCPDLTAALLDRDQKAATYRDERFAALDVMERLSRADKAVARLEERKLVFTARMEDKPRLEEFVVHFAYMEAIGFDFFAEMPGAFLTLLLTVAMGALGSVIHLTRSLFDRGVQEDLVWYLFRPALGIATALAIFVLMKAGQLTFGNGQGSARDLNPYFIAFLAVVSGLFSEQAYQRLHAAGESIFRTPRQGRDRWAIGLSAALARAGRTAEDLARLLEISAERARDYVAEKYPVAEENQRLMAAWLNTEMRTLFTDLPPAERAEAEGGNGPRGGEDAAAAAG